MDGQGTEPIVVEPVVEPVVDAEPKASIVDKIGDMISRAKNAITGGGDDAGTDIPDEFTTAMKGAGYSDEDITTFAADYSDDELKEMIPGLAPADPAKAEEPASDDAKAPDPAAPEAKVEDSQEGEELRQALARIDALEKAQGVVNKKSAEEQLTSFVNKASELFDKTSEEFEVFGKTEELPRFPDGRIVPTSPQMKARYEVWDIAHQLKQAGMPGDKALEFSLNAYKGSHLATEIGRKTIRDLKLREQKLGGKRTSHEVAGGGGVALSGPDVVAEVARRHGIEISD